MPLCKCARPDWQGGGSSFLARFVGAGEDWGGEWVSIISGVADAGGCVAGQGTVGGAAGFSAVGAAVVEAVLF